MSRKDDPDFIELLLKSVTVDKDTGILSFERVYAQQCLNIGWKGKMIVVPYSHVVWLVTHKRWPQPGFHVDHINDNPQDNTPINLQELTEEDSQKKRRGRMVYRSYGTGKYGYGINISFDKRDGRYYVSRNLSRGHGDGDLKSIRRSLGGFDSLDQAESKVKEYIVEIEEKGLAHLPNAPGKKGRKISAALAKATQKIRYLRLKGRSIKEIAAITGFSMASVYSRVRDLGVDKRTKST